MQNRAEPCRAILREGAPSQAEPGQGYPEREGASSQAEPDRAILRGEVPTRSLTVQRYPEKPVRSQDAGMEEAIRLRRSWNRRRGARKTKRTPGTGSALKTERRARAAKSGRNTGRRCSRPDNDDFEFLDLN